MEFLIERYLDAAYNKHDQDKVLYRLYMNKSYEEGVKWRYIGVSFNSYEEALDFARRYKDTYNTVSVTL